jgi:hypothetical protein
MTSRIEQDLQRLLNMPWTVLREVTPEGDVLLRVKEIPSAVGSGESDEERVKDLWESLSESLRALLHFGDAIPLPQGIGASWTRIARPAEKTVSFFFVSPESAATGAAGALVS